VYLHAPDQIDEALLRGMQLCDVFVRATVATVPRCQLQGPPLRWIT
jgi:hypothetical protein